MPTITKDNVVKILDTANPTGSPSDTGTTQTIKNNFLKKDKPLRFSVDLGSGDEVVVEGRDDENEDWEVLHTFTDETPEDIFLSRFVRMRRSTDGAVGESQGFIQNPHRIELVEDSAS